MEQSRLWCWPTLQGEHHVIIIELEAELGLPVMHPGRVVNRLLNEYMTDEQQNFLLLSENEQVGVAVGIGSSNILQPTFREGRSVFHPNPNPIVLQRK